MLLEAELPAAQRYQEDVLPTLSLAEGAMNIFRASCVLLRATWSSALDRSVEAHLQSVLGDLSQQLRSQLPQQQSRRGHLRTEHQELLQSAGGARSGSRWGEGGDVTTT